MNRVWIFYLEAYIYDRYLNSERIISKNPTINIGMPIIAPRIVAVNAPPMTIRMMPSKTPSSLPVRLKMKLMSDHAIWNGSINRFIIRIPHFGLCTSLYAECLGKFENS